jgi:hypothetical protein
MIANTFGRPRLLSGKEQIPLPAQIDDENLPESGEIQHTGGTPSKLDFFIYTLKLSSIMDRVPPPEAHFLRSAAHSGQELGTVLDINTELDNFSESLPRHLVISPSDGPISSRYGDCFELQANVLRTRYDSPAQLQHINKYYMAL